MFQGAECLKVFDIISGPDRLWGPGFRKTLGLFTSQCSAVALGVCVCVCVCVCVFAVLFIGTLLVTLSSRPSLP